MRKQQIWIGLAGAALAATSAGAIATASGTSERPATRYDAEVGPDATADQRRAIEALQTDAPIPVMDQDGKTRGFIRDSALSARDDRVLAKIREGFRETGGDEGLDYDVLFEALRVLDPVPVVDDGGSTVGYWSGSFVATEDLPMSTASAEAVVADLLKG